MRRRDILVAIATASAGVLTGCCALRTFPDPLLGSAVRPPGLRRILAPSEIRRGEGKPRAAIDAHAHFFNASDVNVGGYVEECVAHSKPEPLRTFIRVMGSVLDNMAGNAKTAAQEYNELLTMAGQLRAFGVEDVGAQLDAQIEARRNDIATQLYDEMRRQRADVHYVRAKQGDIRARALNEAVPQLTPQVIRDAMAPSQPLTPFSVGALRSTGGDADGVLRFAGYMMQDRWMNVRTYSQAYSTAPDAFGIDAAFGALVDFDYWLKCPAHSPREDQMKVHALIAYLSGGYVLPLIGYNPWTDIKRNGASLDLVKKAIQNYGYIGVKIYPPVGYRAYGNAEPSVPAATLPRPDPKEVDTKLEALFDLCAAEGVPVMGHSNSSMGREDAADAFGGPVGWRALEAHYRTRGKALPAINLAHFGGDTKQVGDQWPTAFARIMADYPQSAIYGDLAYWSDVRACGLVDDQVCTDLRQRLDDARHAYPDLEKRLMYGSDWLMLSQEPDWTRFPFQMAAATKGLLDPDRFYATNALTGFALGTNSPHRQRVLDALELSSVPTWMT